MDNWINTLPLILIACANVFLMITDDWKKSILCFGVIYLSTFVILVQYWAFMFSLVKLISAVMSVVILSISIIKINPIHPIVTKGEKTFRAVSLGLIFFIVLFVSKKVSLLVDIPVEIVLASLFILICGLLQLGMTQEPYKVFLSILLLFFGFEVIYSSNETSLLVNGLLAFVALLISMVGAYIITNEIEVDEE